MCKKLNLTVLIVLWLLPTLLMSQEKPADGKQSAPSQSAKESNANHAPPPQQQATGGSTLTLPPEEQYLLQKLRIEQELHNEIISWAQTRFWMIAVISVLVGFFGVRALVREMLSAELKDAMRASADAQAAAAQGREAIRDVRSEATKYRDMMEELRADAKGIGDKLHEINSRVDAEGTRAVAAANLKVAAIDQQMAELRRIVENLAEDSQKSREVLRDYERRRAEVGASTASTQAEFVANSSYRVVVVSHPDNSKEQALSFEIINALSVRGFKASSGSWNRQEPVHEIIKIDYKSGAEATVQKIREIVATILDHMSYPVRNIELQQIMVEDDYHVRIFL